MKLTILGLCLSIITVVSSYGQTSTATSYSKEEQELVNLSKDERQWMAVKNKMAIKGGPKVY